MRVLHVLHSMNLGGVETLLAELFRRLDSTDPQFDFLVFTPAPMYFEAELLAGGARIFRLPDLRSNPIGFQKRLRRFFKEHSAYTIVHSHLETTTGVILAAAKQAGIPVRIAHSHNTRYPPANFAVRLLKDACKKKINPAATVRVACSRAAAVWLYGTDQNVVILPNGVDLQKCRFSVEARKAARAHLGIAQNERLFLHVGRFQPQKNHAFLLEAWRLAAIPCAKLALAGDGELRPRLEANAPPNTVFLGLRGDVPALLAAADVFVLPSLFEGLPVSLVEAQASGLPCLISAFVPTDGLTQNITVLPLNVSAWAHELQNTAAQCEDIRLRAYQNIPQYDINHTLQKLKALYEIV
ncbi:MAG: glycosyltransferase [Oscillospiraceae bacterium]|jgi:glycosyltransferase involved in cell wall biosynthesis|nr:glycosyltransferase [Oscillospiraceae bacterium]